MWYIDFLLFVTIPTATLGTYPSADTVLEKKCLFLKTRTTSVYYGDSCFATTSMSYSTTLSEWHQLHKHCDVLAGYKGRLAFIRSREQINALIADEPRGRYFIGARQDPPSSCGDRLCTYQDPQHRKNWYYIDAEGQKQGELNADLWLNGEPNNAGTRPPENIVTLEHLESARLGFNDANGEAQHFPLLCEYQMARQAANYDYSRRRSERDQWGPFLIGLEFINGQWKWSDGTRTDYYRWYAQKGGSVNMLYKPSDGYRYVFLQTSTNGNDGVAGFGYWSNRLRSTDRVSFFCQKTPTVDD
ncbi:unnamed protein product [Toxocara canis]|uniref:C-type lectin domain-containing protein n=1 Tax=Toxocara canis TaxID=6265 RepID=A0A183TZ83_TOXCA|nr:unnamed protein product [Toxocara canis]